MPLDQFDIPGESGNAANLRATYINAAGLIGNAVTLAYETYNAANYSQYQVGGITETDHEHFQLTRPSWATAGFLRVREVVDGTPAGDTPVWFGSITAAGTGATPVDPGSHYTAVADVYLELGEENALMGGNLSSSGANEDSPAVIESALAQADVRVNLKLGAYSPPPSAFPVVSSAAWVNATIRMAATKYAAGYLKNKRERQPSNPQQPSGGDQLIADGDALLDMLIAAGLPGVTDEVGDTDLAADAPVAVAATVDADGCDLPTTDCCGVWPFYTVWR